MNVPIPKKLADNNATLLLLLCVVKKLTTKEVA
jgi:hypothetical protein